MEDTLDTATTKRKPRPTQKLYVPPAQRCKMQRNTVNKMKDVHDSHVEVESKLDSLVISEDNNEPVILTNEPITEVCSANTINVTELQKPEPKKDVSVEKMERTGPDKKDLIMDKIKEENPQHTTNMKKRNRPLIRNITDILQSDTKQTSNKSTKKSPVKLLQVANWEELYLEGEQEDNYNDQPEFLEEEQETEITENVNPKMQELEHVIELYDFPNSFKTQDLMQIYNEINKEMYIKWCDETHALLVLGSSAQAQRALGLHHDIIKSRPMTMAGAIATNVASKCELKPAMKRPPTTMHAARRMITTALGAKNHISREVQEKEREALRIAKEMKRTQRQNEKDAWEGNPRPSTA